MIKFYNSLTNKKEEFKEITKNKVNMYSCGPTVYNYVHIGNLRSFILFDILSRTLKYFGYEVNNIMNLTDVDDKTIINSKKEFSNIENSKERLLKFTEKYSNLFFKDLTNLNIQKPSKFLKASNSIKDIEFLIQNLFEKGFSYVGEDGIYFDISKDKDYGQLIKLNLKNQKFNEKNRMILDEYDKDNAMDFVLWKFKKDKDEPSWTIEINNKKYEGRPGWHIECSAMNYKAHEKKIDIHTGGIDLKFPHHENEIAQSECAFNQKYVNYWIHNEFLFVDGKKMSKSLNNFYTLLDLEKKGFNGIDLREIFLRTHYRKQMNFTFESLKSGKINVKRINDFYKKLNLINPIDIEDSNLIKKLIENKLELFNKAMKDDLNTPIAISIFDEFMNEINKIKSFSKNDLNLILSFVLKTNEILGLIKIENKEIIPKEIIEIIKKRKIARKNKNWKESDNLRVELKIKGFEIKDDKNLKEGYILTKINDTI